MTVDSADVPAAEYISPPLVPPPPITCSSTRAAASPSAPRRALPRSRWCPPASALASVWSQAISRRYWLVDVRRPVETYQLYPGDTTLRIRTKCTVVETSVYTGANELTPGLATDLLDAGSFLVSPVLLNAA